MKKMLLVAGILSAIVINVGMVNTCSAEEICFASIRSESMLGNKNMDRFDLFQVKDAAHSISDITGGR